MAKIAKQRVIIELRTKEREVAMVMIGRAVVETFKGLDIIPPDFILAAAHDGVPCMATNIPNHEEAGQLLEALAQSLFTGCNVVPIQTPKRLSPRESFVNSMLVNRGKTPLDPRTLGHLARTYLIGYLDAVIQYAGVKAATALMAEYGYAAQPDWLPGEEWEYWRHELPIEAMGLPNGM